MHPSQFVVCVFLLIVLARLSRRLSCASSPFSVGVRSPRRRCASGPSVTESASFSLYRCVNLFVYTVSSHRRSEYFYNMSKCVSSSLSRQCVFFFVGVCSSLSVCVPPFVHIQPVRCSSVSLVRRASRSLLTDVHNFLPFVSVLWASFPFPFLGPLS